MLELLRAVKVLCWDEHMSIRGSLHPHSGTQSLGAGAVDPRFSPPHNLAPSPGMTPRSRERLRTASVNLQPPSSRRFAMQRANAWCTSTQLPASSSCGGVKERNEQCRAGAAFLRKAPLPSQSLRIHLS